MNMSQTISKTLLHLDEQSSYVTVCLQRYSTTLAATNLKIIARWEQ
jgi:hypothetical protein